MGGGTAPSGTADYPTYLKDFHGSILFGADPDGVPPISDFAEWGNVADDMLAARSDYGGSPYAAVTAYDPSDELQAIEDKFETWDDALTELNYIEDVEDVIDAAVAKAADLVPTTEIDAVATAFENRSKSAYLRNVARYAAGMFDIQAVMTTQFGMGLAAMELDRAQQVDDVDARLRLMAERERTASATQYASEMTRLLVFKLEQQRAAAGMQMDFGRMSIIAYQDENDKNLGYEVKNATWDLDLWAYPQSAMSAIAGAAIVPRRQTEGERLLAAFGTSASFGIQVGTALGNPGAGIAAGVGSLASQLLLGGIQ